MTTTPEATKGVPRHEGNSTFTPRADHNALADWILENTNKEVDIVGDLPPSGNWPGRRILVTASGGEYRWDGSGWKLDLLPKTTFTPTWTNFNEGAGTNTGTYRVVNGICEGQVLTVLGSGASIPGAPTLALPLPGDFLGGSYPAGRAVLVDNGSGIFRGDMIYNGSALALQFTPAGQAFWSPVSNVEPFAWTSGDSVRAAFRYPVA